YRNLALVEFEINDLGWFCVSSRQLLFDFAAELFLREFTSFVQPGCTIEFLAVSTSCQLRQFQSLCPAHLLQLALNGCGQVLVNGHQVIGLASRLREPPLQKLIEGLQLFQAPVLASSDFAEVSSEFHKACVFFSFFALLPSQDLIDLRKHEERPLRIQLG